MMKKLTEVLTKGEVMRRFTQVEGDGKVIVKNFEKPVTYDGKNKKHKKKVQRMRDIKEDRRCNE